MLNLYDHTLQPTLRTPLQILFWKCLKRKGCSKISKISKRTLCKTTRFSLTLQAYNSEFLTLTKSYSKKNVSCDCSLKQLEICQEKAYNEAILLKQQDYYVESTRIWKTFYKKCPEKLFFFQQIMIIIKM